MHNGDFQHTSKIVKKWLEKNRIEVLTWPAQDPDLNPIENLWATLKRKVRARNPKKIAELEKICIEEWQRIPQEDCKNLIANNRK